MAEGAVAISYEHGEMNASWLEERLVREDLYVDDYERATLIVLPRPLRGENADDVRKLQRNYADGANIFFVADYRNQEELDEFYASTFGREFAKAFGIGRITGFGEGEELHIPYGRNAYNLNNQPVFVKSFVLEKEAFEQELVNTGKLRFLRGLVPEEDSAMYLHTDLPRSNIFISRKITRTNSDRFLWEDENGNTYAAWPLSIPDLSDLFDIKTAGFTRIHDSTSTVYVLPFGFLIPENYDLLKLFVNESAKSRPHVLRRLAKQPVVEAIDDSPYLRSDNF